VERAPRRRFFSGAPFHEPRGRASRRSIASIFNKSDSRILTSRPRVADATRDFVALAEHALLYEHGGRGEWLGAESLLRRAVDVF